MLSRRCILQNSISEEIHRGHTSLEWKLGWYTHYNNNGSELGHRIWFIVFLVKSTMVAPWHPWLNDGYHGICHGIDL